MRTHQLGLGVMSGLVGIVVFGAVAWACTGVGVPSPIYPLVLQRPVSISSPDTMNVSGVLPTTPLFSGEVDVYQHPGNVVHAMAPVRASKPTACQPFSFWKVGTMTFTDGQGSATPGSEPTFEAANDGSGNPAPGVYEVCAFPDGNHMRGYWTFIGGGS